MDEILHLHHRQQNPQPITPVPLPPPTASDVFPLFISVPSSVPSASSPTSSGSFDSTTPATSSSSPASSPSADSEGTQLTPIKLGYLIPTVALMGLIVMSCVIWSCYRCCSRKPRDSLGDAENGGKGPRYAYINDEVGYGRFIGSAMPMEKSLSTYTYEGAVDDGFAWQRPPGGYHNPVYPSRDDQAGYGGSAGEWLLPEAGVVVMEGRESDHRPEPFSRQQSKTSEAFNEMYENEDEVSIGHNEVAFENLRHKSIKRGILNQVQEETNWMDSLRAVAGSVFANQSAPESYTRRPGTTLRDDGPVRRKTAARTGQEWIEQGKKRRANLSTRLVQRKGTTATNYTHNTSSDAEETSAAWSPQSGFKIVQESPPTTPLLRQTTTKTSAGADVDTPEGNRGKQAPMISFLPISPPHIMSPPLENELCFTPPAKEGPGISLQEIAEYVVQSENRKAKEKKRGRSSRQPVDIDQPLPDPRAFSPVAEATKQAKSRNKLFKRKSPTLKSLRYESLPDSNYAGG